MASDSARTLVLPLTVLVSVAVGVFIGNSLAKRADPPATAHAETIPTDDLAAAMRTLTEELVRARRESGALTNAPSVVERAEAAPALNVAGASELREATKQLVAALDLLRTTSTRLRGDGALVEPAVPPDPTRLDAFTPESKEAQITPYLMWTYQQVIDRFGRPPHVFQGERDMLWTYQSPSGRSVEFRFSDGRLIMIQGRER